MLKKILDFFVKDFNWKLIALGTAVLLWFIGMNVNNPTQTRTFQRNLSIMNQSVLASNNIVLLNEDELKATVIDVGVRATHNDLNVLDNRISNLEAYIDLSSVDISRVKTADGPITVNTLVYTFVTQGYEMTSKRPFEVPLMLDRRVQHSKTVQVITVGETAEGYDLFDTRSAVPSVTVSGAQTVVDSIASVQASVNVQDAHKSILTAARLTVFDMNGNDITAAVTLSETFVDVEVSILPYASKELDAHSTGKLASDYTLTAITISPPTVEVVGEPDILASFEKITLDTINLDHVSQSFTQTVDIRDLLPPGVALRAGMPNEVEIAVVVEPVIIKTFEIPSDLIYVVGMTGADYAFLDDTPTIVTLRGPQSDLDGWTVPKMNPRLVLTGLAPGEQSVPLTITLPKRVTQAGTPATVGVRIRSQDTDDPQDLD